MTDDPRPATGTTRRAVEALSRDDLLARRYLAFYLYAAPPDVWAYLVGQLTLLAESGGRFPEADPVWFTDLRLLVNAEAVRIGLAPDPKDPRRG